MVPFWFVRKLSTHSKENCNFLKFEFRLQFLKRKLKKLQFLPVCVLVLIEIESKMISHISCLCCLVEQDKNNKTYTP